ncbi:hypothetical protein AK812_SmicGene30247 [Symbiodinium microadriaticum]|uniref:Uncharacterized protein n=1 Tax=Symbiodinium microadriaticum TaxID=2951 RepID=A0A1Q9CZT8_SYMMI|nr:hypothetical protein AK812_SmicGene30247 [Symbiodinium microadriaticum]
MALFEFPIFLRLGISYPCLKDLGSRRDGSWRLWPGADLSQCQLDPRSVFARDLTFLAESAAMPGPCVSQTTATVQVGSKNYTATVSAEKPRRVARRYEGGVSLSCSIGLVFADGSGCVERSCTESLRTVTFEDGVVNVTCLGRR